MSVRPNWPGTNSPTEVNKLQQHLALLKKEYVKLQNHCSDLEKKFAIATAREKSEDSFVSRLLETVAGLYKQKKYSDIEVLLGNAEVIPAHRFVLKSRSSEWGVTDFDTAPQLDWSEEQTEVMRSLLQWVYTSEVELKEVGDQFCQDLMKVSARFQLSELTNRCEQQLLLTVSVHNCVKLYTTADEIGANTLREHCSQLISVHWDDFTSDDFAHMSAPLLFSMLKAKTDYPLHSAIRLAREDVVFLYLVEHSDQLTRRLNEADMKGELPLLLALRTHQGELASSLVEHGAGVDTRDPRGHTLLLNAVERGDEFSAMFLLEHGACASATTAQLGDCALHVMANQQSLNSDEDQEQIEGMMRVAQKLTECGLSPNMHNNKGYTALHLSILNGHEALFALLLRSSGLALDAPTHEGHTALRFALARDGREGTLNEEDSMSMRLITRGANASPMYPDTGDTLLHLLAREKAEDSAIFLCKHGADVLRTNKVGESALHVASARGLSKLVITLLEAGAPMNLQTLPGNNPSDAGTYRQTPLHLAIQNRHDFTIDALLACKEKGGKNLELNIKNSDGHTPLSLALCLGLKHKVSELITAGSDVNVTDAEGHTLLHRALLKGDSESALFLLEQGASMTSLTPNGDTPLQLAIAHSLPEVVEALCRRGVDMSVLDSQGRYPLWAALEGRQDDIASILVRNGVDTDCWGPGPDGCLQTLLHKALDENLTNVACFLIRSGCELNDSRRPGPNGEGGEEARDGQSPLHMACSWGLEQVVQTLVEHGAEVNTRDVELRTPLHIAVANQNTRITSLLLCHPSLDLSLRDKSGLTPFAAALTSRNNKAAQAILDRMPSAAEQYDNKGYNFLHTAVQRGDLESVLFLLSIGVDPNSRVRDASMCTALHLACSVITPSSTGTTEDSALVVRNLLLAGARADERDAARRSPLHAAAASGHSAAALALLQNGANPDITDADLNSPLHLAAKASHLQVVRVLLTESAMDAEAKNLRGQNPLHLLASYGRDAVAASICELFRECMPAYPLDQPDLEGNTALLLAYMKGNVNICKALVKTGCCLGAMNKDGVTIFNYQTPTKQLLHRLLDMLGKEPPWAEGDICLECGTKFGLTMRKHHCRHCGRLLCSKCSSCDVPILKFGLNKPVRVCGICFQVLQGATS